MIANKVACKRSKLDILGWAKLFALDGKNFAVEGSLRCVVLYRTQVICGSMIYRWHPLPAWWGSPWRPHYRRGRAEADPNHS